MQRTFAAKLLLATLVGVVFAVVGCAEAPRREEVRQEALVFPAPPDPPRFHFERAIYASGDVVEKAKGAALKALLTGEAERAGEGIAKPHGVAARRGKIFVADSVGGAVRVFDIPGRRFYSIGADDPGQLRQPLGVDTDEAGNLYVVDATPKVVNVYDPQGKFLRNLGGRDAFSRPSGIAVDPKGERVYVVDTGTIDSNDNHRVRAFEARTGKHLFDIGSRGTKDGQFNLARDVAVAPNGDVYVVDGGNFRVQVFDRDGRHLRTFGSIGRFPGNFARPREIAIDRSSNVYVTDAAFGNFQIFDAQGNLLMPVGTRGERDAPARYMLPAGIAVDDDGRVYVADQFFRKIEVYRPAALKPAEGFVAGAVTAKAIGSRSDAADR